MNEERGRAVRALLGPQRQLPSLPDVVTELGIEGHIATITAGWQEREADTDELHAALGERAVNLRLYARLEAAYAEDDALFAGHRHKQDSLRRLQRLYRLRLAGLFDSLRSLLALRAEGKLPSAALEPEIDDAIGEIRRLDQHHLGRVATIERTFSERYRPLERDSIARHRHEIADIIQRCGGLALAGGHVAALLNRLRLFGIKELVGSSPIIAWSAGAMALTSTVVLFHDTAQRARNDAEVMGAGLGLCPGIVALPHARTRLRLQRSDRIEILARRFSPSLCVALDDGGRLLARGNEVRADGLARCLGIDGKIDETGGWHRTLEDGEWR